MFVMFEDLKILGSSLDNEKFTEYVQGILSQREKRTIENKSLEVNVSPDIAEIFRTSKMISSKIMNISKF